jgi:hypothetical protein
MELEKEILVTAMRSFLPLPKKRTPTKISILRTEITQCSGSGKLKPIFGNQTVQALQGNDCKREETKTRIQAIPNRKFPRTQRI